MRDELSPAELNLEFYGKPPVVTARFYDKEVLDVSASRTAGHRVMCNKVYIHQIAAKEKDYKGRPVEAERPSDQTDQRRYPEAWQAYLKEKEDGRLRSVSETGTCIGGAIAAAQAEG